MRWPSVALGDVATIERHGVDPADIPVGTRYVGLENIAAGQEITGWQVVGEVEVASTKFHFDPGHVLYGKLRPNLGKIARPAFSGVCSTDILPIRPGPKLDRSYLRHFLAQPSMIDFAASRAAGANLPRLSPRVLATFDVPLPPLEEQRRIAAILDQADALRAKRRTALALLNELRGSVFRSMFGPAGTHLQGAEILALGDALSVKSGTFLPAKAQKPGPYPVFGGNGITGRHDEYLFNEPKVVIGRVGAYCGAVHLTPPQSWITDNALYVSATTVRFSRYFLSYALREANLNQYASQSGQPLISGARIANVSLRVPSYEAQMEFEARLSTVDATSAQVVTANEGASSLAEALTSAAFSGHL